MIELTLLVPWCLFLFVFVIDMGFYEYSLISVENATRIAAEYTSQSSSVAADSSGACTRVLAELSGLPNIGSTVTTCASAPLIVTASSVTGTDGNPATSVTIAYQGLSMIPIPGLMQGRLYFNRNAQMRISQ
jgi:Flp pilus assembly protein TadG